MGADRSTADLLNYAHPVIRVNDLVADTKTLVIHEGRSYCSPELGLGTNEGQKMRCVDGALMFVPVEF